MECCGHLEIFANLRHKEELLIIYCPAGFLFAPRSFLLILDFAAISWQYSFPGSGSGSFAKLLSFST